jgi:hypothetical protein
MIKTKTQKIIALVGILTIAATSFLGGVINNTFASKIGTGSVVNNDDFNSDIIWDEEFPGTASGKVSGVNINAKVLPILNMFISSGSISLGDLEADVEASGSLDIEIGTNAANGVTITAKS